MAAGRYDIEAEQGSTFVFDLEYQNSDGTAFDFNEGLNTDDTDGPDYAYGVRMQIRKTSTQATVRDPLVSIRTDITDPTLSDIPVVDTDGEGGGIIYFTDVTDGLITIKILASTMATLSPKRYFYDIELFKIETDGNEFVTKLLKGVFDVAGEVSV